MDELAGLTIAEASDGLRDRRFSSAELVSAVLNRATDTEPRLHAYARLMPDQAREAAAEADRELARGVLRGAHRARRPFLIQRAFSAAMTGADERCSRTNSRWRHPS